MADYDFIIIGGGISGLAVGAILSHHGQKVLLAEQAPYLGGRYKVIKEQGCLIEYNLHLNRFADDGIVPRVLQLIGEKIDWVTSDCPMIYLDGRFFPLPHSTKTILWFSRLSFMNKLRFLRMYKEFLTEDHTAYYHQSVFDYLEENGFGKNVEIKRLIGFYCQMGLVPVNFKRISVGELMLLCKWAFLAKKPFGYPLGGWKKCLDLFQNKIEQSGTIRLDSKVDEIMVENKKAIGIRIGQEKIPGRTIICALPLQHLFEMVEAKYFSSSFSELVRQIEPTAAICLDFILNKKISDVRDIISCSNPHAQGVFISNLDPSIAAEGKQVGSWILITQPKYLEDSASVEAKKKCLKEHLETMFPGLWEHLSWERWMVLKMVNGAAPFVRQTSNLRPATKCVEIENLYFTGDTINGQGGGGDVVFDAILKTAKALLPRKI